MASSSPLDSSKTNIKLRFYISRNRRRIWLVSAIAVLISFAGLFVCWFTPSIGAPLRPGLDFTGGTQIKLERRCERTCEGINTSSVSKSLANLSLEPENEKSAPSLSRVRVQVLDGSKAIALRMPFLTASQAEFVIKHVVEEFGPFESGGQSVETIGPTLGRQLLRSSLVSLLVAFVGIAFYISIRYDKKFAFLALVALTHDVIIVCGIFAWLGFFVSLEIDSLFAVALLTIAGYSVNDTVVVFDRIRERSKKDKALPLSLQIDRAVSATFTRTIYTSSTTLLPLIALILFGGTSLYWFAIALASGVLVGSWSSIALAPSLLTMGIDGAKNRKVLSNQISSNE